MRSSTIRSRSRRAMLALVSRAAAVCLLALGFAASTTRPLFAHGKGVLTIGTKQAAAGDTLHARGSKLAEGAGYRIELRAALKTYPFGRVRTDTSGSFELPIALPADAPPGSYVLVAIAADGDVSAEAEFLLTPTGSGSTAMKGMPGMPGMPGMDMSATAAMMDVPRHTTAAEMAAIVLLLAGAAAAGLMLLRPRRVAPTE